MQSELHQNILLYPSVHIAKIGSYAQHFYSELLLWMGVISLAVG